VYAWHADVGAASKNFTKRVRPLAADGLPWKHKAPGTFDSGGLHSSGSGGGRYVRLPAVGGLVRASIAWAA